MAIAAKVKDLFLFSHDPNNDDEMVSNIHKECKKIIVEKKSSLRCHNAKEVLEISLD